jgi:flavodoxin/NAD-dependent dihydropyrimidine dehydrogenase PreA subunit
MGLNMIFYFSGTGNSLQAAKSIAEHNGEKLISIAALMNTEENHFEYTLKDSEAVGFVHPVYAWGPPRIVLDFIKKLELNNYKNNYIFSVVTCGDNIGNTMKVLQTCLKNKNLILNSGFSIRMPNNYIIMGNVDSKETENKKLLEAEENLKDINKLIEARTKDFFQIKKGPVPGLLTSVVNPLFNKGAMDTKKFYANDNCTSCGICEKVCNCQSIKVEVKPKWGEKCTQCLACIHYCPVKAIQYGKGTEKKERYNNPNIKVNEMIKAAK